MTWSELRDDTLRLNGETIYPERIDDYVNPLIQQRLQTLGREGWEADGATDARTLLRQGRLVCREHASLWSEKHTYTLTSVTIRLRRNSSTMHSLL